MSPERPASPGAHGELHEARLHALVVGDLSEDDPLLQGLLAGCSECREHLDELRAVTGLLDEVMGEERRSLAEVGGNGTAPGSDRVAATLRVLAARSSAQAHEGPAMPPSGAERAPSARAKPAMFGLRVAAAAAAVVATGWVVRLLLPTSPQAPSDLTLGDDQDLELLEPVGQVPRYEVFRWSRGRGPYVRYTLSIWNAEGSATQGPVLSLQLRDARHWTPSPEEQESLPASIRWQVEALDEFGVSVVAGPVEAQRAGR